MLNDVYLKLNEGLGGCYERIAYSNILKRLAERYNCKSILELNATYIAGVPGYNSCLLAQAGYDVTVAVLPRDYEDTKHVWGLTGLKADIMEITDDFNTQFKNNQFDLVYNHLAFDQYLHPEFLVNEMMRVSNNLVVNLTLNPFNYGWYIHYLNHKITKEKWGHGYPSKATIGAMKRVHKMCGLKFVEQGACDAPFWQDTIDAKMGGTMTYMDNMPDKLKNNWVWTSINPACQTHWLIKLLWNWEDSMPLWFKQLAAHHLYVASRK